MSRRTIAVCVTGYNWEYESRVIDGINSRCEELDINLLIFASLIQKPDINSRKTLPESIVRGESEIFNLINYDLVDGVIILGGSIVDERVIYSVSEKCGKHGIPMININDPDHRLKINVDLSDRVAMEYVMRHIVERHGKRRINFIGGFPGNLQTEERLAAYKKVLTEYGIPIEEERIGYGEFWIKAKDCTERFMRSEQRPEAIVCANDTMAFFCMDYLKENGYKIPDDVIVTGFDGIKDCEDYDPTLTTVRPSYAEAGKTAVDILLRAWRNEAVPEITYVESALIKNQSCGCGEKSAVKTDFYSAKYKELNDFREFNSYILDMNTQFASAVRSAEIYRHTDFAAEFFDFKKMFICVCSDVERKSMLCPEEEIKGIDYGISETMLSMVQYGHNIPNGLEFPSSWLVPEKVLEAESRVTFAFSPIYFKDTFIGYIAYEPSSIHGKGDFFAIWLSTICHNVGSFYMKNELEYVVSRLEELYVRDPLTGLYNRRGLEIFGDKLMKNSLAEDKPITIICADVDNLKVINDNFGHEGGDNAILKTAEAIRSSLPEGSVCSRMGGDEFMAILSGYSAAETKVFIDKINCFLEAYNRTEEVPYKLGCSSGFHTARLSDKSRELVEKLADEDMYRVKTQRKTHRR